MAGNYYGASQASMGDLDLYGCMSHSSQALA